MNSMYNEKNIIADASFYLFFMEDISETDTLIKIIDRFDFFISNKLKDEINVRNNNLSLISSNKNLHLESIQPDIQALFEPLMSTKQREKGEADVIFMAFHFLRLNKNIIVIMDDKSARSFLTYKVLPLISTIDPNKIIKYTLNFLEECSTKYNILDTSYLIKILEKTKKSRFRVNEEDIDSIIYKLKGNII